MRLAESPLGGVWAQERDGGREKEAGESTVSTVVSCPGQSFDTDHKMDKNCP